MAVPIWDGSDSTAWTTAANWSTGVAPANGDEVVFDGRTLTYEATTLMAVGDTGPDTYDLLHVKSGHSGTIGAAGSPLHTQAAKIIIEGSGTYYIEISAGDAVSDVTVATMIVNNASATVYLTSNVNIAGACQDLTDLFVIAGTVYIGNNGSADVATAVNNVYVAPLNGASGNATVVSSINNIRLKGTTYNMNIYMQTGTFTSDSAIDLIEMFGGTFNYGTDLAGSPETGCDITTLRQHGGTFNWYPDDSGDDAYIGDLWLFGGTFQANATTNMDRAKALGNGAGNDIHVFQGATMNIANNQGNVTIAAGSQLWNFGGTITTDRGSQLAVTYNQP